MTKSKTISITKLLSDPPINQSISHSVIQSFSLSVSQSVSQSVANRSILSKSWGLNSKRKAGDLRNPRCCRRLRLVTTSESEINLGCSCRSVLRKARQWKWRTQLPSSLCCPVVQTIMFPAIDDLTKLAKAGRGRFPVRCSWLRADANYWTWKTGRGCFRAILGFSRPTRPFR